MALAATNHLSKLLRGNIVTGIVTTLVISSADFARLFRGRVSGAQVFKNVATTASGVAGGTGGWMAGAAAGAAFGSAFPVVGTAVGGIIGAFAGGTAASKVVKTALDKFIEDDAKKMLTIVEKVFGELASDYLLSKDEAKKVIQDFQKKDLPDTLRDMCASNNRKGFARRLLEPLMEKLAKNRKLIRLPSDKEILQKNGTNNRRDDPSYKLTRVITNVNIEWPGKRCILCLKEVPLSREHIIPKAIGGILTCSFLCKECNSSLGTRVDAEVKKDPRIRFAVDHLESDIPNFASEFREGQEFIIKGPLGPERGKIRQGILRITSRKTEGGALDSIAR